MLHGWCRCSEGIPCQLIVVQRRDGLVELNFHGTSEHSITLTVAQQEALSSILHNTEDQEIVHSSPETDTGELTTCGPRWT